MSLFLLLSLLTLTKASDLGVIGYFEKQCPQGWQPYLPARQRFILSAGPRYPIGATGGTQTVTLTVSQMPRHNHYNSDQHGRFDGLLLNNCFSTRGDDIDQTCGQPNLDRTMPIQDAGGDQPHPNMPPYYVLNACKKITDVQSETVAKLNIANQNINEHNQQLTIINQQLTIINQQLTYINKQLTENTKKLDQNSQQLSQNKSKSEKTENYSSLGNFIFALFGTVASIIAIGISVCQVKINKKQLEQTKRYEKKIQRLSNRLLYLQNSGRTGSVNPMSQSQISIIV